ncbi:hypothetical protein I542_5558 [Mycobacteroides abscessus 1948]|uniref:Uncharacterized protein n=1 Tax=Mycobacteroides abscessus 1948 TaxID=1299323 RepID=A0A829QSE6_9MYCO|nr:hypothetical protein I542_5558 [Mycobacteroides abscessus 1948]
MPDDQHGDRRIRHRIDLAEGDSGVESYSLSLNLTSWLCIPV